MSSSRDRDSSTIHEMHYISLSHKPDAPIAYTYIPQDYLAIESGMPLTDPFGPRNHSHRLLLFVNGLILPQKGWFDTIDAMLDGFESNARARGLAAKEKLLPFEIMTYDRYGAGQTTAREPDDAKSRDPTYGHDLQTVVRDLKVLLQQVLAVEAYCYDANQPVEMILVGSSIGCAIIRLFAAALGTDDRFKIRGIIFLDSIIANTDFFSLFPDPDDPDSGFDLDEVESLGCDLESYRDVRQGIRQRFHPTVANIEGLDRRNLPELLPHAHSPKLPTDPHLLVIGHDPLTFADQTLVSTGWSTKLVLRYLQSAWERYNAGLLELVSDEKRVDASGGVKIAQGSGHFVPRDVPIKVAEYVQEMLAKLEWR